MFRSTQARRESGVDGRVTAAEIKLLSGAALRPVLNELLPEFEKSSGHKVTVAYGSIGSLTSRFRDGERGDVLIVSSVQIDELRRLGKLLESIRVEIAQVGIGVFSRKGAKSVDVSSVEGFKRTVLATGAIAYPDPDGGGPAGRYIHALFDQLGIATEVQARTKLFPPGPLVYESVADGHADIGFEQISLISEQSRVDFVGPLPASIQNYTLFAAGIGAKSRQVEAGMELITFLCSPAAAASMRARGFELPNKRY
jgi:molybdate transport system substrate-binding protein